MKTLNESTMNALLKHAKDFLAMDISTQKAILEFLYWAQGGKESTEDQE